MDRRTQLLNLQNYMKEVDKDITMILQNLQWDRNYFLKEEQTLSICKYDQNHKVPHKKLKEHEEMCYLKCNGYSAEEFLLPELLDMNANTVVKFNSAMIQDILQDAAEKDPLFKRGHICEAVEPLSVERLQATYTADERGALHAAVLGAVRAHSRDEDFVLPSGGTGVATEGKSWLAQLAEQRDRRRRRTKYRAPPKTKNYSVVLRDVIAAQMEMFNEVQNNSKADNNRERHREDIDHTKRESSNHKYNKNITNVHDIRDTVTHRNRQHRERNSEDIDIREEKRDKSYKHKSRKHIHDVKDTNRCKHQRQRHIEGSDYGREKARDHTEHKNITHAYDAKNTHIREDRHQRKIDRDICGDSRRYDRSGKEQNKEQERSAREDYKGRDRKHGEYRKENSNRSSYSFGSNRKRGAYEVSNERRDKDRSHSSRK